MTLTGGIPRTGGQQHSTRSNQPLGGQEPRRRFLRRDVQLLCCSYPARQRVLFGERCCPASRHHALSAAGGCAAQAPPLAPNSDDTVSGRCGSLNTFVIQSLFDVLWVHLLYVSVVLYEDPESSDLGAYAEASGPVLLQPVNAACRSGAAARRR
jgi:hypothetical protein